MKKKPTKTGLFPAPGPDLYLKLTSRRRRPLILPRKLREEADSFMYRGDRQDRAHKILIQWADLELQGAARQERNIAGRRFFAQGIWRRILTIPLPPRIRKNTTWNATTSFLAWARLDAAPWRFLPGKWGWPGGGHRTQGDAETNLDKDKFNGRTAVQQCWDYLNALPNCPWGIVSNFVTFRLYHRDKTPLVYQEFRLQDLSARP